MDTTKILAFRHPSQIELLLESFLSGLNRLPVRARKVTDRSDLPSALQKIAIQASKQKVHWGAWVKDGAVWFFTAEIAAAPSSGGDKPALKVCAYNERGRLAEYGLWINVPRRGWQRCAL